MRFTASGVFLLTFYSVQNRELENVILTLSLCLLVAYIGLISCNSAVRQERYIWQNLKKTGHAGR